jgi:hypothetical protein
MKKFFALGLLLVSFAIVIQTNFPLSTGVKIKVDVLPKLAININKDLINFGEIKPGKEAIIKKAYSLQIKSTTPYQLTISASGDLIDAKKNYKVPIENLKWKISESKEWHKFTTREFLIDEGTTGIKTYSYDLALTLNSANPAGNYSTKILFTVVGR